MKDILSTGFDVLADHVVITDASGKIVYLNPAAEKKTGFTEAEALGKKPGELWGGGMPKEFYRNMWQTIGVHKQPFVGEAKNKKKDGTEYWQEIHISPILDKLGEVKFFIAIEPDITDKKEKDKLRNEFISKLAHQVKSPLTATKWGLEYLLERAALDESQKKILNTILEKNTTFLDLVAELAAAGRGEKNPV